MSTEQTRSEAAAVLGSIKTPKKAMAARKNGKLGGRPRNPKQNNRHAFGLGNGKIGKKMLRKERASKRIAGKVIP